jgi:hypothetical protein
METALSGEYYEYQNDKGGCYGASSWYFNYPIKT